jgi:excisionase family DNA binding protein
MLTLGEAARHCGCGKSTISKAIARGRLKATPTGNGSWSIEESDLEAYAVALGARRAKTATGEATDATVELRVRAEIAEQRLTDLKAMYADMVRQRDDMAMQRTRWETVALRLTQPVPPPLALPAPATGDDDIGRHRPWWWRWRRNG